ncbi:DUF4309 domain-containing protein [Priestia megaterium]|nr:DUF4309 domain-containing protein [Priestia megaterium]
MKKILTSALAFSLALGGLAAVDTQKTEAANNSYVRLAGKDRLATAIEIAKKGWSTGLTHAEKSVILARSDNPVDALSAASLAGVKDAPILLTNSGSVDERVLAEIKRLGTKKVYVLGSASVVSDSIIATLKSKGLVVERVAGPTRFETAQKINEKAGTSKSTKAIVVNGDTVVDALSAISESANNNIPIYLTKTNRLPVALPTTVKEVVIYGSANVVSNDIQSQLTKQGKKVTRVAGPDRFSTNVAALKASKFAFKNTILVRGTSVKTDAEDYPDAVASAGLADKLDAKIVLTHPTNTNQIIKSYLSSNTLPTYVLGSPVAVTDSVLSGLGYNVPITKSNFAKSLLLEGKLPTLDVAIGATTNEVINKLGKSVMIDQNDEEEYLFYDYENFSISFDYATKKVDYISTYDNKISMTEAELESLLGSPEEFYEEDGLKTVWYEVGDYSFNADINMDTKKVEYMDVSSFIEYIEE